MRVAICPKLTIPFAVNNRKIFETRRCAKGIAGIAKGQRQRRSVLRATTKYGSLWGEKKCNQTPRGNEREIIIINCRKISSYLLGHVHEHIHTRGQIDHVAWVGEFFDNITTGFDASQCNVARPTCHGFRDQMGCFRLSLRRYDLGQFLLFILCVKGIIRNERNLIFATDAPSQQQTLLVRPTDELTKTLSILWHCWRELHTDLFMFNRAHEIVTECQMRLPRKKKDKYTHNYACARTIATSSSFKPNVPARAINRLRISLETL